LKIGQALQYKVGYQFFASSKNTTATAYGSSPLASWTPTDGASTLLMTGVAATLAVLAF